MLYLRGRRTTCFRKDLHKDSQDCQQYSLVLPSYKQAMKQEKKGVRRQESNKKLFKT